MAELRSITQTGMVLEYYNRFNMFLEKVEYLEEHYVVSLFVSGLKDHMRISVRLFTPKSLAHAFALARLQESALNFGENCYDNVEEPMLSTPIITSYSKNTTDNKNMGGLTSIELDEKENFRTEEAGKEMVVKLKKNSNRCKVPKVRNFGNMHTTTINHSHLEDRGRGASRNRQLSRSYLLSLHIKSLQDQMKTCTKRRRLLKRNKGKKMHLLLM